MAAWLKSHFRLVWWILWLTCSGPLVWLVAAWLTERLGTNPLETLTHTTGRAALVILTLTLTVTPLRRALTLLARKTQQRYGKRVSDWNWLVRTRRMLGLWTFAYAVLHVAVYVEFDIAYDWSLAWDDFSTKRYLLVGLAAFVLLWPLALTSNMAAIKRLGRNWLKLHRTVYLVAVLALLHFWWLVKPGVLTPWPETLALFVLLGYRLLLHTGYLERWEGSDGLEASERPYRPQASGTAENLPGKMK
jgi:methionine sulfoxide reductase heme-binding subunit